MPDNLDYLPYFAPELANITKVTIDTSKPIKSIQAKAFCGLRLLDADGNTLNSPEEWNTFWCPYDEVDWGDVVELPDNTSLIGLELGMAELEEYEYS